MKQVVGERKREDRKGRQEVEEKTRRGKAEEKERKKWWEETRRGSKQETGGNKWVKIGKMINMIHMINMRPLFNKTL